MKINCSRVFDVLFLCKFIANKFLVKVLATPTCTTMFHIPKNIKLLENIKLKNIQRKMFHDIYFLKQAFNRR